MRNYLAPGVYLTPPVSTDDDVRLVRTDIAGFVGYAERGPIAPPDSPTLPDPTALAVPLTSWDQFRVIFGGMTPYAYLPCAVEAFFQNGGRKCYVVRVAASSSANRAAVPRTASFTLSAGDAGKPVTTLTQAWSRSSNELTVVSTAGFFPGAIIGVGPSATRLAAATVKNVVNDHSLILDSRPEENQPANTSVWLLTATVLSANAYEGQTDVPVASTALFAPGDTIALSAAGMSEFATIADILSENQVRLTTKLKGTYLKDALLRRQTAGLRIDALSPGNWGNRLLIDLTPRTPSAPVTRFDLRISLLPGPDPTLPRQDERFLNLSLDSTDRQYAPLIVNDKVAGSKLIQLTVPSFFTELPVRDGRVSPFPVLLGGGRDGLQGVTARDFLGGEGDYRGLRVLEEIDEIGMLAVPDAVNTGVPAPVLPKQPPPDKCAPPPKFTPPPPLSDDPTAIPRPLLNYGGRGEVGAIIQAMIDQARRLRYRVAILDTPDNLDPTAVAGWLSGLDLPPPFVQFAALYYPWLLIPDALTNDLTTRRVPPSGHVAGVYAQVDNARGVQFAPANVELQFAVGVGKKVTAAQQGTLNEQGINVIRSFPGRGIRVWGARSLAASPIYGSQEEWWFIHVRRTLSMIEDSVEKSMQWTVFQPNDYNLRRTLTHSLTVFLEQIWQTGALKGATAAEAFYVKCDDTNNPQALIDVGQLVCEVGVAIAAPMEFLTFVIRQLPDGAAVVEG
jgi:phage tail sheath protein FI